MQGISKSAATPLRRRTVLAGIAAGCAAVMRTARADTPPGPFALPPLPYGIAANEPWIDAQTMMLHHDKHHAAYVANLNAALKDHGEAAALPLEELLRRLPQLPDTIRTAVRNNAGGHANHSMFWQVMGGKGGAPSGDLGAAVTRDFGGLDALKAQFNKAGTSVFGSGWVFVTVGAGGKLVLTSRPNQDTPLSDGTSVLFGNDVWEHAYYLKYQNRRAEYLAAWWNVLDWPKIEDRYRQSESGTLKI